MYYNLVTLLNVALMLKDKKQNLSCIKSSCIFVHAVCDFK